MLQDAPDAGVTDALKRLVVRAVCLVGGGLLAGVAGGVAAGLGARLLMFVIRLANPAFNGAVTHEGVVNGRWTVGGTLSVVMEAVFVGALGGWLYVLVRPALIGSTVARGIEFGVLVLLFFGSVVLDGNYEYSRFVPSWQAVAGFALLHPLYGLVVAAVADAMAPVWPRPEGRRRWFHRASIAVLVVAAIYGAVRFVDGIRFRYGF